MFFRQQGIWMFYFIQCTRDKSIRKVICFSQRLLLFLIIAEVSSSRLSVCSTPCCQVDNKDSYVNARTHRKNEGKTGTLYWNWFTLRDVFLVTFEEHNPKCAAKAELKIHLILKVANWKLFALHPVCPLCFFTFNMFMFFFSFLLSIHNEEIDFKGVLCIITLLCCFDFHLSGFIRILSYLYSSYPPSYCTLLFSF